MAFALVGTFSLQQTAQAQETDDPQAQFEELQETFERGAQAAQAENKDLAYDLLTEAHEMAIELEQEGAREQIEDILQRVPRQWGNEALQAENYEEAIEHFEKGIEVAPENAYMPYGKGLALFNLDRDEEAVDAMIESLETAREVGDGSQLSTTEERLHDHYISRASNLLSAENPTTDDANQALSYLDDLEEHLNPSPDAFFFRATAYFALGDYQDAITSADQGLELFDGSASDEAQFHFVKGESQFELGNLSDACATFENATFGDYQARAEHYLEHECE